MTAEELAAEEAAREVKLAIRRARYERDRVKIADRRQELRQQRAEQLRQRQQWFRTVMLVV